MMNVIRQNSEVQWRILIVELIHHLGLFILHTRQTKSARATETLFGQFLNYVDLLSHMPEHNGEMLLRHLPQWAPGAMQDMVRYQLEFGPILINGNISATEKNGSPSHSDRVLRQAFKCFAEQGIHSIVFKFPQWTEEKIEQLRLTLNIIARYQQASEKDASITFRYFGRVLKIPLVRNRLNQPDPNLTVTAGLNGLSAVNARELIKQAEAYHSLGNQKKNTFSDMSDYERIFMVRSLRSQLVQPPLEINQLPWLEPDALNFFPGNESDPNLDQQSESIILLVDKVSDAQNNSQVDDNFYQQKNGRLAESAGLHALTEIMKDCLKVNYPQSLGIIDRLISGSFNKINVQSLSDKLLDMSKLFGQLEKAVNNPVIIRDVSCYFYDYLSRIPEEMLQFVVLQRRALRIISPGQSLMIGMVHYRLTELINLVKTNLQTKKKIAAVRAVGVNFGNCEIGTLAVLFEADESEFGYIIEALKNCYDNTGLFRLVLFNEQKETIKRHADLLFEMLWCFFKQSSLHQECIDILIAIRKCIKYLHNTQDAIQFILSDIFQNPHVTEQKDQYAFFLANKLLHGGDNEHSIDHSETLEEILNTNYYIDPKIISYCIWRLDIEQFRVLTKFKEIHELLEHSISNFAEGDKLPLGKESAFLLEREMILFMTVVGGVSAQKILRDALERYGDPKAEFYKNKDYLKISRFVIAVLGIVVQGIGRHGNSTDIDLLKSFEHKLSQFNMLDFHSNHSRESRTLLLHITKSIKAIQLRSK